MLEKEQTSEVVIKQLSPDDWGKYKSIRLEALQNDPQAFGGSYADESQRTDAEWQERVKRSAGENPRSLLVVAENEARDLIGTVGAFEKDGQWRLVAVYVNPAYRGKGVSKKLVARLMTIFENHHDITELQLMVNTKQTAAVKLYESFGFKISSIEKDQIMGDGQAYDEYVMKKELIK